MKNKFTVLCCIIAFCSAFFLSAQSHMQRQDDDVEIFRGRRMMPHNSIEEKKRIFVIERIFSRRFERFFIINILFSLPVNPNSIDAHTFLFNNQKLPLDSQIKFNRMGTLIQINIPVKALKNQTEHFTLAVMDIVSYNGVQMQKNYFPSLQWDKNELVDEDL